MKILKQVQDDGASILKQVQDDGTMKILYPKGISMLCKGQLNSGRRNADFFVFLFLIFFVCFILDKGYLVVPSYNYYTFVLVAYLSAQSLR